MQAMPNEYWHPIRSKENLCKYEEAVWHLANQWQQLASPRNFNSMLWQENPATKQLQHPKYKDINDQQKVLFGLSNGALLRNLTGELEYLAYGNRVDILLNIFRQFNDYYLGLLHHKGVIDSYAANVLMLGMWHYLIFMEGSGYLMGILINENGYNYDDVVKEIQHESENYQDFFERVGLSMEHEELFKEALTFIHKIGDGPWESDVNETILERELPKVHDYSALMEARSIKQKNPQLASLIVKAFGDPVDE